MRPRAMPWARRALRDLRRHGVKVGLVTASTRGVVEPNIERLNLAGVFQTAWYSDDVERSKPHPEALIRALDDLGVAAADTVYVGDTIVDFEMTAAAGATFVAVGTTMSPEAFHEAGVDLGVARRRSLGRRPPGATGTPDRDGPRDGHSPRTAKQSNRHGRRRAGAGTIEAMTRALAAFDAVTERVMLPLTVLGLVVGLAATVAGNDELAWWCWTVPAVLVGPVARHLDPPRPAQGPGRRRRHRGPRDRRRPAAGRVADRSRHRGDARDRRLAGALRGGPGPPRAVGARVARSAHRPPSRGRIHRGPGHRGRRGRRPPARQARRGRAGRRQRDGRRSDPRRVRPDRRGPPRDSRGGRSRQLGHRQRRYPVRPAWRPRPRSTAPTPASSVSSRRPSRPRRRSCASPTATRCCSCP